MYYNLCSDDFNRYESPQEITKLVKGKEIDAVTYDDDRADDFLVIKFTDGTELCIRYDWIYEWEVRKSKG